MNGLILSLQDKLRNVAKSSGKDFQLILTRYFQERLLFRLSQSLHCEHFCLKGGVLLYALERESSRPTLDLDLLALKIKMDKLRFNSLFQEICSIPFPEDGVQFDTEKISTVEIMEQRRYAGLQIKIPVLLGNMRQLLKVDIGFGDVVTPPPHTMTFPTLLDMEAPEIKAYSPETVIAEKFEAMIDLAESNSRMKDFYDVYKLLSKKRYSPETLELAVAQTFQNRQTVLRPDHPLFSPDFPKAPSRKQLWASFLKRTKLDESLGFEAVVGLISEVLKPKDGF